MALEFTFVFAKSKKQAMKLFPFASQADISCKEILSIWLDSCFKLVSAWEELVNYCIFRRNSLCLSLSGVKILKEITRGYSVVVKDDLGKFILKRDFDVQEYHTEMFQITFFVFQISNMPIRNKVDAKCWWNSCERVHETIRSASSDIF